MNRRVPLCGLLFAVLLVLSTAPALAADDSVAKPQTPSAEQILGRLKKQHPRLLIDAAGFEDLGRRIKTDATLKDWDERVHREADKMLAAPLAQHVIPDGLRLLDTSRRSVQRCYTLGLMYRLHGDRRHLDRLWKELEAIAAFPDFNPRHFLDTAEMTHALGIAYDWLYDSWTDSQRATIRKAMIEMGLKPGLPIYEKHRWWAACDHNWNQVCNGGLTVGALAIADEEPELAGRILQSAVASVPLAMHSYAPDGAWGEGPGYWAYATSYNVLLIAALDSALGTDYGLSGAEGFAETGLFPLYMQGPSGLTFNFSDSGDRAGRSECMFWLANRFHHSEFNGFVTAGGGGASPSGMIWYRGPHADPASVGLALDKYFRKVEAATMRGSWSDPQTTFVGIQAGSNQVNHNQLDLGSFVLDALGKRWAVDLGADNYNLPGYFGGKRYDYYRLRAEGHNTLVLGPGKGPDQDTKAVARIARFESKPERAFAVADLTPAYAKHAGKVQRGIALLDRRAVLVQDELTSEGTELWWFVHTPAEITLDADGRTATLTQGKSKLLVRLLAPADARFEARPAAPLPTSPNPEGQRDNKGISKLAIHREDVKDLRLAVQFEPAEQAGKAAEVKPLERW